MFGVVNLREIKLYKLKCQRIINYKCHYIGKLNKKGKRKQRKDKYMGVLCKPSCKGTIEIVY